MKTSEFKYDNWIYRVYEKAHQNYDFDVIDPNQTLKPRYLYKHYSLNGYGVESTVNYYLYASHPLQLNDPYDCNRYVFDFEATPMATFKSFLKNHGILEGIENRYRNNKKEFIEWFLDGFWHIMYSKIGIVSMSDLPMNIQMWAYYSNLNGFQVKLDTEKIPKILKGPFKIRYSTHISKIPIKNDFVLPILFQTLNKENNWDHESEWRYLIIGPDDLEVPYSLYSKDHALPHNRKFNFDISALVEINLGCYFFLNNPQKEIGKNRSLITISNSRETHNKIKLLEFICNHPNILINMIFWKRNFTYQLVQVPIKISKVSSRKFELLFETEQQIT